MRQAIRMPHVEPGQRIGLFGGSFNPPHEGHLLVSETARRRLNLDQVWWIITPGNPLKNPKTLAPLADRINKCRAIAGDPAIKITAFELATPNNYTADTISQVKQRNSGVNFVWIMGADNLFQFHKWQRWRDIANDVPIAVIDRPGSTLASLSSMTALALGKFRVDETDGRLLATMKPPAWTFIHGPRSSLSSTGLRNNADKLNNVC